MMVRRSSNLTTAVDAVALDGLRNSKVTGVATKDRTKRSQHLACVLITRSFATGFMSIAKLLICRLFADSGALLDGRVALRPARKSAFRPSGRSPVGFRRLGGRTEFHQKRRNDAVDPNRCQAAGVVATLPRQPQVRHVRPRQPELGESCHNQPTPPVGLFGMVNPRRRPAHALFEEAEGVSSDVGPRSTLSSLHVAMQPILSCLRSHLLLLVQTT